MLSPAKTIFLGYTYVITISIVFHLLSLYENSTFFHWGPPVVFFGKSLEGNTVFYSLHLTMFFHQIVNNCVNSIVYPWIINYVQDPKCKDPIYSKPVSILIINLFDIYSQIDTIFILMGFLSQISFVFTISFANILTSSLINYGYLKRKEGRNETEDEQINLV